MINRENIHISQMAERAILLTWQQEVGEDLLSSLLQGKEAILKEADAGIVDVVQTYNALLIKYYSPISSIDTEISRLEALLQKVKEGKRKKATCYQIPVCYHEKFGLDLSEMMEKKQLSREEIVQLHTEPTYTVYFIGFLPGFPYLGGLSEQLFMERKEQPRKRIPKGAVGIGGEQTGIYPSDSPGGWQLIGNCPLSLFDSGKESPCLLQAGDRIQFYEVGLSTYQKIKKEVEQGNDQLKKQPWR